MAEMTVEAKLQAEAELQRIELAELREFREAARSHVDQWVNGEITPFDAIATIARYLEGGDE